MFNSLLQSARSLVASSSTEAAAADDTKHDTDSDTSLSRSDDADNGTAAAASPAALSPPAGFVFACTLDTLPVNQRRCLSLDKRAVVVYRNRAQRSTARSTLCPEGYTNIVRDDGSELFTLDAICYHMGVSSTQHIHSLTHSAHVSSTLSLMAVLHVSSPSPYLSRVR